MKYVEWAEPYSNDPLTTVICAMSFEDVIVIQKYKAGLKGFIYESDEQAIEDFIAVHWGTIIERK